MPMDQTSVANDGLGVVFDYNNLVSGEKAENESTFIQIKSN